MILYNFRLGAKQIRALQRLGYFCKNFLLHDSRQDEIRTKCLHYWQIPDNPKRSLLRTTPEDIVLNYVKNPGNVFLILQLI